MFYMFLVCSFVRGGVRGTEGASRYVSMRAGNFTGYSSDVEDAYFITGQSVSAERRFFCISVFNALVY